MSDVAELSTTLIESILNQSTHIGIKKLSNNDRRWADGKQYGHQNGPYIPMEWREGTFFPPLLNVSPGKPHIFEARIPTCWVRGGEMKESRLVLYSNKGLECHLTGVPKTEFAGISPASWFLIGKGELAGKPSWYCLVIDSADEEAYLFVETLFELAFDFEYGLFEVADVRRPNVPPPDFLEELLEALVQGEMLALTGRVVFPLTRDLAVQAQNMWLAKSGEPDMNPFRLSAPGDVLMQISRDIEYRLFRKHTMRYYSARLLEMLSDGKANPDLRTLVTSLVSRFDTIYKEVMISAGQRSKSRAGYSFELHVSRMLKDGNVPYEEQTVVGNQRPDFILPSRKVLQKSSRAREEAFILSLKTVLRERWKQVLAENKNCDLFLGTVDDGITGASIAEMRTHNIYLVVPERLKKAEYAEYESHENVITFHDFFHRELKRRKLL